MRKLNLDVALPGNRKFRNVLVILLPFFLIGLTIFIYADNDILHFAGLILLLLMFSDIILIAVLFIRKYHDWTVLFLFLIILAIWFRSQRWPFSGTLFQIGYGGLGLISLLSSFTFLKKYNHIPFLKYAGFSASIVLFVVSIGILWKTVHWPMADIIVVIGLVTFILFLFAFIFTLPGSNYINWNKSERIVFFRTIIVPMAFVFIISVLMFVFPDLWTSLTRLPLTPFNMSDIDLLNKPGLY